MIELVRPAGRFGRRTGDRRPNSACLPGASIGGRGGGEHSSASRAASGCTRRRPRPAVLHRTFTSLCVLVAASRILAVAIRLTSRCHHARITLQVLTAESGARTYGGCLTVYEPLNEQLLDLLRARPGVWPLLALVGRDEACPAVLP